ncbi:lysozyme [Pantoea stewartii]|uniref:Lysozyme n=1 Tax=Pantoea stewartii subsp. stewartii DC283 TaxID=660596 RepID=H3R8Z1_PANSE|nr:lysozyme [Pantoea stewartii]ARF51111.1 lysozyme [Pantoea stewartii subsp. stewartii DC283]EHU01654.1 lysozyme [Pantoea stewartii subsp. stewartii DC283]KAB0555141.1 lysozyme [Pantoea stewartii subsp. stewartii]
MKVSNNGINLIKRFEGLEIEAYRDSVNIPTIGYGHTRGVKMGDVITGEQADAFLREDLQVAELTINTNVKVKLTQNQFDALTSFVFNLGSGNFVKSTLLKKLNLGDYAGAADEFGRWVNAGGKQLAGLVKRRAAEREVFLS